MTLFFDTKVQFLDGDAVSTECAWHPLHPLFAVASFNQNRGACVTIFDDLGDPLRDISFPVHSTAQATSLCWHPELRQLIAGWENGELNTWAIGHREFLSLGGSHKSPIVYVGFSEKGGRMITADSLGNLTAWHCDPHNGRLTIAFVHELRDSIVQLAFRRTVTATLPPDFGIATRNVAVANGFTAENESPFDTMTNWRPKTTAHRTGRGGTAKDNYCFYVGCQSGTIYYFNPAGTCSDVLRSGHVPIVQLLWHPKREVIVMLFEDMTVGYYMVESSGGLTELERVKVSGRIPGQSGAITFAGNALVIITGDFTVRIWDVDTSDNFLLPMNQPGKTLAKNKSSLQLTDSNDEIGSSLPDEERNSAKTTEVFTCIAYSSASQTLCAGTNQGRVYTWRKMSSLNVVADTAGAGSGNWQLNNVSKVRGAIKHCFWGFGASSKPCILINCIASVYILKEQTLLALYNHDLSITQKSANKILVEHSNKKSSILLCDIPAVTDMCATNRNIVVSNKRTIIVYKISTDEGRENMPVIKQINTFQENDCVELFIWDELIIILTNTNVKFCSFGGVTLREIESNDTEGDPIGASLTEHYLTIFTFNGFVKVFDVSRHEPKMVSIPKCCFDMFDNFGEVIMARCNATATYVAITIATESLVPDGKLHVWNVERDAVGEFDFVRRAEAEKSDDLLSNEDRASRLPNTFHWDQHDGRFIVCEARLVPSAIEKRPPTSMSTMRHNSIEESKLSPRKLNAEVMVNSQAIIFFVKNDNRCELKKVEAINLNNNGEQLLDMCAPHVITLKMGQIERHTMTNFRGIENCSETTRKLILDFSLFIADGKMDEAFRCIRSIQSNAVWENLAKMCIQTGRLDVAKVCLGHLNRAISVRALRIAMADETLEPEAKIAVLAIELGLIDEAEALYKKCGRYDLLNELLQASNRFSEALHVAERHDRVHLKNTYFQYAEWLKQQGNLNHALIYYDKSSNNTHNVTQTLINDPILLKQYMTETTDPNMLKWWAQYTESTGNMEIALKIYQKAEDWFSQVRILCFLGELSRANAIANKSGDKAACYHLARYYENVGKIPEAIQFYTKAETYSNAVRICKENDLPNELWTVANVARPKDKAVAAIYFEETGDFKRAVELYHRSGMLHKAVEMAFASKQPETLQIIAAELDHHSDPELIEKCADFFLESQQAQKAVQTLATAKQFERAIDVCRSYNVPITELLAELLTPSKDDQITDASRLKVLIALGDMLHEQGDYHTATKKFTQAGDKVRAIKSLLKSGDTDKIVFFASMSRQKEVYVMAANYLQSLNWQADSKILKNIIQFYTKGHAYDLLANFYANCAQVEIDEFHDYEKAAKALQEASRCVSKIATAAAAVPQHQRVAENLQTACIEVKKVLDVQQALERGDYHHVINVCRKMLELGERPPVRMIHLQAALIEALIRTKQYSDALNCLREMSTKSSDWSYKGLLEKPLIEKLAHECGIEFSTLWNLGRQNVGSAEPSDETEEDEIREEIE